MSQTGKNGGVISIVGGGQLGRMLTEAALPLGFQVTVLNPSPGSPAAQVGAKEIIGDLYDVAALQNLADTADFLTIEIEHLDAGPLQQIAGSGKPVNPAPATIQMIQDKYRQKMFLREAGIPVADFMEVTDIATAEAAFDAFGKMVLKSREGGYDGRGNTVIIQKDDIAGAIEQLGSRLIAEKWVPFTKELAVMVARDFHGNVVSYPVTQTIHERNICIETLTPAPVDQAISRQTKALALKTAEHLQGAGVFGIEMFLTNDGEILVNEIAPRVHNSGHYTIEACFTSQFEQHIRAVTGRELGPTDLKVPAAVMVNILGERDGPTEITDLEEAKKIPGVSIHLYGKSPTKIDRKMGHITAVADTLEKAQENAEQARKLIDV